MKGDTVGACIIWDQKELRGLEAERSGRGEGLERERRFKKTRLAGKVDYV